MEHGMAGLVDRGHHRSCHRSGVGSREICNAPTVQSQCRCQHCWGVGDTGTRGNGARVFVAGIVGSAKW